MSIYKQLRVDEEAERLSKNCTDCQNCQCSKSQNISPSLFIETDPGEEV